MNIIKWVNRKMGMLAFAFSSAEKDAFRQHGDALGNEGTMSQSLNQGMLADALLRGEITLEVEELRWRLYKVLAESKSRGASIVGYDDDGLPIVKTYTIEKYKLDKIIRDDSDPYEVEMLIKNEELTKSTLETLQGNEFNKEATETFDLVGHEVDKESNTLGEISFDDMMSLYKSAKTIFISRELRPKFEIETYTNQLIIRNISETEKLLEFYVSIYPDEYNRKSRLFIAEIEKAIKNPRVSDFLDINKIKFITSKAIGVEDGLEFEYDIVKFHKIVTFRGYYVIKFIATPIINGDDIFLKYKMEDLEERYKNKEAK
jgi:hypothetical protein